MTQAACRRARGATALAFVVLAGCAMGNADRRRALNHLDEHYAPSTTQARWLASPVALPAGLAAGAVDAVLLHPATQFDDAWRDTVDVLWDFDQESRFRRILFTPLAAVATGPVYVVDWCLRAVFDIDDHPGWQPRGVGEEDDR